MMGDLSYTKYKLYTIFIAFIIMVVYSCSTKKSSPFDEAVSGLFFNVDVAKSNQHLIDYYKNSKLLKLDSVEKGFTLYPPLSALSQDYATKNYKFRFNKHPTVSFNFEKGDLIVMSKIFPNASIYDPPILRFVFSNEQDALIAFSKLTDEFSRLSTKKIIGKDYKSETMEFFQTNSTSICALSIDYTSSDSLHKPQIIIGIRLIDEFNETK